jgi:hypothetical protein
MTTALHRFLITFVAAYRTQKPFVVVARSGAALQCLAVFRRWGLIALCSDPDQLLGRPGHWGASATTDRRHITVWFRQWPTAPTTAGTNTGLLVGRSPHQPSHHAPHRLEVLYRPSRSQRLFRSHRWLRGRLPHLNTLYLLSTSRGILTSDEALRYRLGGVLLLALHLL